MVSRVQPALRRHARRHFTARAGFTEPRGRHELVLNCWGSSATRTAPYRYHTAEETAIQPMCRRWVTSGLMHRGKQHLSGAAPRPGRAFALDVLVEDAVLYFGKLLREARLGIRGDSSGAADSTKPRPPAIPAARDRAAVFMKAID